MTDPKLTNAVKTTAAESSKFLTLKVRKRLYPIVAAVGVIAAAFAPVFPGVIGDALNVTAAACTALIGGVAVSHLS